MAAHYDDPHYSYFDYWRGREYEHLSEIFALNTLLKDKKFHTAVDIGGGYGRLIPILSRYAKKITLVEPSAKLRSQAAQHLASLSHIIISPGTAQSTRLPDSSQELVVLIRVIHHLPDPLPALTEIRRILKPGGFLVLEFANSHHFKARVQSWLSGQPILPLPIEKRSPANIKKKTIPFVNHSPQTIVKLLNKTGFAVVTQLSVSNLRLPLLKQSIPQPVLLRLEYFFQPILARLNFGPSIFMLTRIDKPQNP